jgi:hypothetical protein
MPTHPGFFAVLIIWDSIHSHHKFNHSDAYGPFVVGIFPILAGDIEIIHFEITDRENLKKALESPVTQMSKLSIRKGQAAGFIRDYNAGFDKYIAGENYIGTWTSYPYEAP